MVRFRRPVLAWASVPRETEKGSDKVSILEQRFEHSFDGTKYSVSVEAVCWKSWENGDRTLGRPTPWEIPTDKVADLFATILYGELEPWDLYKVADPMANAWIEQFWPSE